MLEKRLVRRSFCYASAPFSCAPALASASPRSRRTLLGQPPGRAPMTSEAGTRALDLLDRLVAIPSVTGAEGPLLDFLEERFRTRGFTVRTQEVSANRRNLFIYRGPTDVVFMPHAEAVPP